MTELDLLKEIKLEIMSIKQILIKIYKENCKLQKDLQELEDGIEMELI